MRLASAETGRAIEARRGLVRAAGAVLAGAILVGCASGKAEEPHPSTTIASTQAPEQTGKNEKPDYEAQARVSVNRTLESLRRNGLSNAPGEFYLYKDVCMVWDTANGKRVVVADFVQYRFEDEAERLWLNFAARHNAVTRQNVPVEGTFTWGLIDQETGMPLEESVVDTAHDSGGTFYIFEYALSDGMPITFDESAYDIQTEYPALQDADGRSVAVTFLGDRQVAGDFVDKYCHFPGQTKE